MNEWIDSLNIRRLTIREARKGVNDKRKWRVTNGERNRQTRIKTGLHETVKSCGKFD